MFLKKRNFLLIELIIVLFLTSIILSVIFGYFSKITKIEKKIENLKHTIFQKNNLQIKLNNIFSQISLNDLENFPFYTEEAKTSNNLILHIAFNNGIDPDPSFSGNIKAKLFINTKNQYLLQLSSLDKKEIKTREEVLYKNIKNIEYKFLSTSNLIDKNYLSKKLADQLFWYKAWPEKYKILPSAIYININNDLKFVFFIPGQIF